ncbi:hypothetical protein OsI_15293 [Oryza sativa Indica Group]|uniref:Uncharacterized protein n=1 Tax=Oryza sativa subsp. indica TaxID=39946 RepID=B8AS65_ORYSI|nr:hypothetical protein OsI_15293 [Oryza sativa Indica Group]
MESVTSNTKNPNTKRWAKKMKSRLRKRGGFTNGMQHIDRRVAEGNEHDAVGAHLHDDADRLCHAGSLAPGEPHREDLGFDQDRERGRKKRTWKGTKGWEERLRWLCVATMAEISTGVGDGAEWIGDAEAAAAAAAAWIVDVAAVEGERAREEGSGMARFAGMRRQWRRQGSWMRRRLRGATERGGGNARSERGGGGGYWNRGRRSPPGRRSSSVAAWIGATGGGARVAGAAAKGAGRAVGKRGRDVIM